MMRSNAPSPIRTSATPTAAEGGGYDFTTNHSRDAQDLINNIVASHEQQQQQQQHYYNENNANNDMRPAASSLRQGRFLLPEDSGNVNSSAAHPHQQQQQYQLTSPSQVTFQPGAELPQPTTVASTTSSAANNHLPFSPPNMTANFMFEDSGSGSGGNLPTEAQLTLLCLDYLRSLRRSYQNPQDLLNGEGLDSDYLSLAIWSLSRAFVSPDKLKFGVPKVSTIIEESGNDSKKVKEIQLVGGGGLGGVEDECVGNDSFYRLVKKGIVSGVSSGDDNFATPSPKEVFALTDDIKLPSMKDITNEVLLSYNNDNGAEAKDEEECPIYEQNDMHLSNSHRFYLLNGMASGDDSMGMMGANSTNKDESPSNKGGGGGPSIIDGGPLTLVELTSVALSTLNARSRIEAEREVVQDPLFESFIQAAGEKGFFNEKKLEEDDDMLSPEEEEYRQRLLYKNKYRMAVAKFRSKLAVREEQQMSESDEGVQTNVTMEGVMTEVERAPADQRIVTEVERAPVDSPSPVASPPSPPKASKDPPASPDKAAKVLPSPAAKLSFDQEAERLNAQGNELMQKKQFIQALELYTAALKISPAGPNSHVYYSNRAAAKLSLGDAESSIQDSESALTMRPDYVKAHSRLGLAHYASGRYEDAVVHYEAALDLEPGNEWVKNQYEKARRMLVKMEEEEEVLAEAKEDDDWPSPFVNKSKEARAVVCRADEYKDNGNAYMKNKKYEEALHQYNLAIDTSADGPNSHIYYSNRAAAYFHLGKYEEAADDCLASIELDDSYEKAHSRYGLSLFFLGDYEGSIHAYRKSLDLAPDNKASLSYLAKAKASLIGRAAEKEMQEEMAKKLNLGKRQESEEMELESK